MQYDLVLADADGTLFNFHAGERVAIAATLRQFELPDDAEIVTLYSRCNAEQWRRLERGELTQTQLRVKRFEDFFVALKGGALPYDVPTLGARDLPATFPPPAVISDAYIDQLAQQRVPMAGAEDFLRRVTPHVPVYLVTNGIGRVQRGRFERSELRPYLSDLLISEELNSYKPAPDMIYIAMRRAGVADKSRVIFLGDSLTADIAAANNAGVPSILFTDHQPSPDGANAATFTVPTLSQAADIILR